MESKKAISIVFSKPSANDQAMQAEEREQEKYPPELMDKLRSIREALKSGDTKSALSLVDECLGESPKEDMSEPQEMPLEERLSQAYKKKNQP